MQCYFDQDKTQISFEKLVDHKDYKFSRYNFFLTNYLLYKNKTADAKKVIEEKADFGIAVDPDVDRLAFISEDGSFFGEEYTLVAIADFILSKHKERKLSVVSNLSSNRALRDIANYSNASYHASAVGEVNVVKKMKSISSSQMFYKDKKCIEMIFRVLKNRLKIFSRFQFYLNNL